MIRITESTEMTIGEFCQKLEDIYYSKFPNSYCVTRLFEDSIPGAPVYPGVFVGGVLASEEEYNAARSKLSFKTKNFNAVKDLFNLAVRFEFFTYSGENAVYWTHDDEKYGADDKDYWKNAEVHGPKITDPMPSEFFMGYSYTDIVCKTPTSKTYKGSGSNGVKTLRFKDGNVTVKQALSNWTKVVDKFYKTVTELYDTDNIPDIYYNYCDVSSKI